LKEEIELKLLIQPQLIEKLINSSFFRRLKAKKENKQLENTYFDTDNWLLQCEKIALRIRKDGNAYIQTLKTKGKCENGLHKRLEWEWPLASNNLNTALIPAEHWPLAIEYKNLKPIFNTNFQRKIWLFEHQDKQGNIAKIEMALDQGVISTDFSANTEVICELELELISGNVNALNEVAYLLKKECPSLAPSDASKAARGFALIKNATKH